jgi:hypothetical protein
VIILTGNEKSDSDMSSIEMIFIDKDKICKLVFNQSSNEIVWRDDESDLVEEQVLSKSKS